jgi:hypothetical protein
LDARPRRAADVRQVPPQDEIDPDPLVATIRGDDAVRCWHAASYRSGPRHMIG